MNPISYPKAARHLALHCKQRGSVLLTALVFAFVIALGLTSLIQLSSHALNTAQRSLYNQTAMNLAESGIEQALWSMNDGTSSAWSGWTPDGNARKGSFTFDLGQNTTATVRVWVENANPGTGVYPKVVAKTSVTPPGGGSEINRYIEVTLQKSSVFANGLVGRDYINFNGKNVVIDSYDSTQGAYEAATASGTNKYDHGSVGVLAAGTGALDIGNSSVWGTASIGASSASAISAGPHGTIGPFGTSYVPSSSPNVSTNFSAAFSDVSVPTPATSYSLGAISSTTTLPRSSDSASTDGRYYYYISGISLAGSKNLTIDDKVVLIISNPLNSVSLAGSAGITVNGGCECLLYTGGDVDLSGNGVVNASDPAKFQLWSTKAQGSSGTQTVKIVGNGEFSGIVYAPAASIQMKGGGSRGAVFGAIIGQNVTMTGNANFHYDESLANFGGNARWGLRDWKELTTPTERDAYATQLNF